MSKSFVSFLLIGSANTLLTLSVIAICYFFGSSDELANFFGVFCGMMQSIWLNSKYTFQQRRIIFSKSVYFFLILLLSYAINFYILYLCLYILNFGSFLSQLIAIIFYVFTSFALLRTLVYKK
jgi:putative flippase GtrA